MNLPVIGEALMDTEKSEAKKDIEYLLKKGMIVRKIINYKGGSTKYVASYASSLDQYSTRKDLEREGWKVGLPYYSNGEVLGFRVSKEGPASRINVWGGT